MSRISYSKLLTVFVCTVFITQAFAQDGDDNSEKMKMLQAAVAKTEACQALPFDVPKSIIWAQGSPIVISPAAFEPLLHDVNMKMLLSNCITAVTNSNEQVAKQDNVNSALINSLRAAAQKFLSTIGAFTNKYQDSTIDGPVATIGIRG